MKLKFLAISDTHLGENTSFLTFPHGRQYLVETLIENFGNDEIEELIIVGDVADNALASISQVITHTSAFIHTLISRLNIKKIVYIPGNHDHTLWTEYMNNRQPGVVNPHVTDIGGELLVDKSIKVCPDGCDFLLTIFFEYVNGPAWSKIQEDRRNDVRVIDFAIANPLYAEEFKDRAYVFTHGTHFKSVVTISEWIKKLVDYTELDSLANIEIDSDCDVNDADTIEELEEEIASFVDSLWINSRNNPTSRSDQLWYLYHVLSGHFGDHRDIPNGNERREFHDLPTDRINELTEATNSIDLFFKHFFSKLIVYLHQHGKRTDKITFVYGDTHDGGFGNIDKNGSNIRIYNLGGWVVHHEEDHPPCHVFAVDDDGKEYMLDISFKDVNVIDTPIINLAAADFENRERAIGRVLRWILRRFG